MCVALCRQRVWPSSLVEDLANDNDDDTRQRRRHLCVGCMCVYEAIYSFCQCVNRRQSPAHSAPTDFDARASEGKCHGLVLDCYLFRNKLPPPAITFTRAGAHKRNDTRMRAQHNSWAYVSRGVGAFQTEFIFGWMECCRSRRAY